MIRVVLRSTLEIPSGSKTDHNEHDIPCLQDDLSLQSVVERKKRRINGKQKSTLYPQPNVSSK